MGEPPLNLRGLLDRAMQRHQVDSTNALSKIARKGGMSIVNTTLSRIYNGSYAAKPSEATIKALAYLAGVSYNTAHEAVGLGLPPAVPFASALPRDSDLLTPQQRRIVIETVRAFIEAQKALAEARGGDNGGNGDARDGERWLGPDSLVEPESEQGEPGSETLDRQEIT